VTAVDSSYRIVTCCFSSTCHLTSYVLFHLSDGHRVGVLHRKQAYTYLLNLACGRWDLDRNPGRDRTVQSAKTSDCGLSLALRSASFFPLLSLSDSPSLTLDVASCFSNSTTFSCSPAFCPSSTETLSAYDLLSSLEAPRAEAFLWKVCTALSCCSSKLVT
jgi:hypothetical protein